METLVDTVFQRVKVLTRQQKVAILLCVDVALVPVTLWLTSALFGGPLHDVAQNRPGAFLLLVGLMAVSAMLSSVALGLPRIKLNAYEHRGILQTSIYALSVGGIGSVFVSFLTTSPQVLQGMVIFTMALIILSVGARIAMRSVLVALYQHGRSRQRVLIYGAGQTGVQLATALGNDDAVVPVAFVDDNSTLNKILVAGLPVYPPIRIEELIKDKQIDRVVLAMPSISRPKQARIARRLEDIGCEVSVLPSFASLVGEGDILDRIQPASPADFLNRANHEQDLSGLCDVYAGRTVMITGAGGSIGSELTRQILTCKPARVVLFEISELALYQLCRELDEIGQSDATELIPVLGSVMDAGMVRNTIKEHGVEIVLHAAAYKHVTIVEKNVLAGLRNNVIGTKVLADAARDAGVGHFIFISTDKAVRPTSIMGASKRLAEMVVQDLATRSSETRFGIVRFGNVLGSSGSVIPLFEEQIARGGPVTLTHPNVTRYFMTLSEAARLVLLAGNYTSGSDMFVLDMGTPIPIRKLAQQMIERAGYTVCDDANPDGDIEISIIGLSPGEKLHEELVTPTSELIPTNHPKILRASEEGLSELELASALRALTVALDEGSEAEARQVILRWVGQFDTDRVHLETAADVNT